MNCYFDTSIYNSLLDDQNKNSIIENIKEMGLIVIPSLVNLCEILQTPNEERKQNLLNIYNEIRNRYHALKPYRMLLRDTVKAIQGSNTYIKVNLPVIINNKTDQICKNELKDSGKVLDNYALKGRKWLYEDKGFKTIPDVKTYFRNSYDERMNRAWINLFLNTCESLGIKELNLDENTILEIIKDPESFWKYQLDTFLLIFYRRAMKTERYGRKNNPDGADLEQTIYLCWSDIFVIRDENFYDFLMELKKIQNYQKKIFKYEEFKEYLESTQQK